MTNYEALTCSPTFAAPVLISFATEAITKGRIPDVYEFLNKEFGEEEK